MERADVEREVAVADLLAASDCHGAGSIVDAAGGVEVDGGSGRSGPEEGVDGAAGDRAEAVADLLGTGEGIAKGLAEPRGVQVDYQWRPTPKQCVLEPG